MTKKIITVTTRDYHYDLAKHWSEIMLSSLLFQVNKIRM